MVLDRKIVSFSKFAQDSLLLITRRSGRLDTTLKVFAIAARNDVPAVILYVHARRLVISPDTVTRYTFCLDIALGVGRR
jgi:hypothetical protein